SSVHVLEFCDLNITPTKGCSDIACPVSTSASPIVAFHTVYLLLLLSITKQYSVPCFRCTGAANVKVVGTVPSSEVLTSEGFKITSELGTMFCVGKPFSITRMSTDTG